MPLAELENKVLCRSPKISAEALLAEIAKILCVSLKKKLGLVAQSAFQDFNIRTGAEFFATTLENAGGNVLVALGHYNGWTLKMTIVCSKP